jgi:ligand-binding sensor domain-containing protein/DNA-binding CsgD family transcriptional regulator
MKSKAKIDNADGRAMHTPGNAPAGPGESLGRPKLCRWGLLLLVLCSVGLRAEPHDQGFQNLSIEDGLAQNTVTCITADRRGLIWIGTDGGLNRYDGHIFRVFNFRRGGSNCLSHDRINCMEEDADGILWVGTSGGGLNRFDPLSEEFRCYRNVPGDPGSLSNDSLRVIYADGPQNLWIGTDNGLNLFDRRSGKCVRYLQARDSDGVSARNAVYSLHRDGAGTLWAGTGDGLFRFDPASREFTRFANGGDDRRSPLHNQINTMFTDGRGTLWLGTDAGLVRFDKQGGTFQFRSETSGVIPHLYRSRIFDIYADRQGRVWVATESGLYFFPRQDQLEIYFQAGAIPRRLLMNRFVISVYQDREGIIWTGTLNGVWKCDLRTRQFFLRGSEIAGKVRGSGIFPVLSACRQGNDLWVGTYRHGLIRIRNDKDEAAAPMPFPGNPLDTRDMAVPALLSGRDQTLWIGTNRGLYAYNPGQGSIHGHYAHGAAPGSLSHDRVAALCEDRSGRLWIGTQDGLNLLDRARGTFSVFRNGLAHGESIGIDSITAIIQDRAGALWIGTDGGGLNLFDGERGMYVRNYRSRQGDGGSLSSDKVNCLLEDRHGRLWVGTNSGGLCCLDRASGRFTSYTSEMGLANNDIMGILEDERGNLWLSTNRGLSRFDPLRRKARNYTARDGLQGDEFMPMSCYKAHDGEMFFGGVNGLTSFYPGAITDNPYLPPVIITGVEVFSHGQKLSGDLSRLPVLKLGPRDRIVAFSFAALSFSDPDRNQYAYKIEGLNRDWIPIGNRHEITVSNLRPGSYVFRVKGSNNHGLWNEQGAALAISMRPPWWQTWWFRVPAFLLLLLAFILWNRSRTRRMAARIRSEAALEKFFERHDISQREKEIIHLLLQGKSNKEIENALFIAMGTVKNHIYSIYQKIGVKNRAQFITLFKNLQVK